MDENEYHLGLVTHDGSRKPAFDLVKDLLAEGAPAAGKMAGGADSLGARQPRLGRL